MAPEPPMPRPGTSPAGCMPAVVRAYREMRGKGQPDRFALEAAVTVYLWHHPQVPSAEAQQIVSFWVADGVRH
jgi:hypothetical protein